MDYGTQILAANVGKELTNVSSRRINATTAEVKFRVHGEPHTINLTGFGKDLCITAVLDGKNLSPYPTGTANFFH